MPGFLKSVRNSITWHAICFLSGIVLQSDHLKQVKTIETAHLVKGDHHDRLTEVIIITEIKGSVDS